MSREIARFALNMRRGVQKSYRKKSKDWKAGRFSNSSQICQEWGCRGEGEECGHGEGEKGKRREKTCARKQSGHNMRPPQSIVLRGECNTQMDRRNCDIKLLDLPHPCLSAVCKQTDPRNDTTWIVQRTYKIVKL